MNRQAIAREDLFYPYICHAFWDSPSKFHVIYQEGLNNPKIIKTFDDYEKGKAFAKELNIKYLHETGWYDREFRVKLKLNDRKKEQKLFLIAAYSFLWLSLLYNLAGIVK